MGKAIAYLRVSTQQQHRSGLGIEAQRTAVGRFAEVEGIAIIGEFVEAETGKGPTRSIGGHNLPRHWLPRAPPNAPSWCPSSTGSPAMSHSFPG